MRPFPVLIAAIVLAGCATAGTKFEWENARKVTVGMPEDEVVALMGKPNSVTTRADVQVWTWIYVSAGLGSVGSRRVTFPMKDGRVTAIPNLTQFE